MPLWTTVSYYGAASAVGFTRAAVAVDGSNNVIVTGSSLPSEDWANSSYATIQYSSDGVPLWTNRYGGPGNIGDDPQAVAVDGNNNVIVTGHSASSTNIDYPNNDYATIKYSSEGLPLWTNRYDGPGSGTDLASAVAVDRSGNVIVTGLSWNGTNHDYATIKYICVPSPVLTGLQLADGTVQLRVEQVLQPGTLVMEASADLTGWASVFTNTTPTNVLFYTDPAAGSHHWRFYRAFQFP